jgi:hypothetical protein
MNNPKQDIAIDKILPDSMMKWSRMTTLVQLNPGRRGAPWGRVWKDMKWFYN